uniref:Peptidase S1 domain-containing protein n=1 Tax=Daphnia galeata TaxID=27404 RepID=A0A8J2WJ43_9CRUS|nr:unnamed protein product [Daphnia galeata]
MGEQISKMPRQHQHRNHHRNNRIEASLPQQNRTTHRESNSKNINGSGNAMRSSLHGPPWSKCNKKCRQNRQRKCISSTDAEALKLCAQHHVLKQERTCRSLQAWWSSFPRRIATETRESKAGPQPRRHRPLHLQRKTSSSLMSAFCLVSTLFSTHRGVGGLLAQKPVPQLVTVVCGNTVLHEEAYCYTEGTDCEKWYSGRSRYTKDDDKYEHSPTAVPERSNGSISNSNTSKGQKKVKDDQESGTQPECGVSMSGSGGGSSSSGISNLSYNLQLRIIGGREATPGRWPWQVAILNRFKEAFCGGTLIGTRWVLTAAHCLRKRLYVRIGEYDLVEDDGTEMDFRVEEVFVHPEYDPETVDNDVALLRLPEAIKLGQQGIRLACLPQPGQSLPITQKCTIIGWGKERSSHVFGTEVLHEAEVPIVKTSACREVYEDYFITENMFCAGYRKGRIDSCAGDSGGPLLCSVGDRWTIFGITSFGEGCGKRGKFGIYTKVPNYVSWIQRVIDLNGGI